MTETTASSAVESQRGSAGEVFLVALRLGLTSFGGPIAHLGYFERTYVRERKWLAPDEYGGLVALCQMVPGSASSQVGYLIGLRRAGWSGAFAAWAGFTLPWALVMFAFALLAPRLEGPTTNAVLHGLKLVAVAVVAQAVWSMARNLCPDRPRAALALLAAALLLVISGSLVQIAALLIGAVGGALLCRNVPAVPELPAMPVTLRIGGVALALFLFLLVTPPLAGRRRAPHSFGAGRHLLQSRRTRLRRRPCRAPITARCAGPTGLAIGRYLSRRLRLGTGNSGAAVHVLRLSRRRRSTHRRGVAVVGGRAFLHFFARRAGRAAGMAMARPSPCRPSGFSRDQRRRCRRSRGGIVQPDLAQRRLQWSRCSIALTGFLLLERWRVPPLAIVVFCVGAQGCSRAARLGQDTLQSAQAAKRRLCRVLAAFVLSR
jgi:chromate transporter